MSYNNKNYFFGNNNYKDISQLQQSELNYNLFNRNNKFNYNFQNQYSNKTANNFSYNFLEQKQLLNSKEKMPIYNTYYSNFQSQANQTPYKVYQSNYNNIQDYHRFNSGGVQVSNNQNQNNIFTRYNPILNQISQNSMGIISSTSSYPLKYNSINNSISNNMTNATSSYPIQSNSVFPTSMNVNKTNNNFDAFGHKLFNYSNFNFNYNSESSNSFLNNNVDKRNYSSYDYQMKENNRRKQEELSNFLRKQIEEKKIRNYLEKQKEELENLKSEQKYQDYLNQQKLKNDNLKSKKTLDSNHVNTEFVSSINKINNSIYFNNNNEIMNNINKNINNLNEAINLSKNNYNLLERNKNKRPITSSMAQNGLGIINNVNSIPKPTSIRNRNPIPNSYNRNKKNSIDKIFFPFIPNKKRSNINDISDIRNQNKSSLRAKSYNMKNSNESQKKSCRNDYSIIGPIIENINLNLKGITYRSKYEVTEDEDKEKKDKEKEKEKEREKEKEINLKKIQNKNNGPLINISKIDISKIKNSQKEKDDNNIKTEENNNEKINNKIQKDNNNNLEKKENIIHESKIKDKPKEVKEKETIIDNKSKKFNKKEIKNKDNNELGDNNTDRFNNEIKNKNIDNNIDNYSIIKKEEEYKIDKNLNFDDINKCYKEDNEFLDFDDFSEINKSVENDAKKEINEKILNKSIQKNTNFDDICNVRYSEEFENNENKDKGNKAKNDDKQNKNNKDNDNEINNIKISNNLNENKKSTLLNEKNEDKAKNDESDLVQEKPEDYDDDDDNINIGDNSNDKYDNNFESRERNVINSQTENKSGINKVQQSEALNDSYCDEIIKNMDNYRNIRDSKSS